MKQTFTISEQFGPDIDVGTKTTGLAINYQAARSA